MVCGACWPRGRSPALRFAGERPRLRSQARLGFAAAPPAPPSVRASPPRSLVLCCRAWFRAPPRRCCVSGRGLVPGGAPAGLGAGGWCGARSQLVIFFPCSPLQPVLFSPAPNLGSFSCCFCVCRSRSWASPLRPPAPPPPLGAPGCARLVLGLVPFSRSPFGSACRIVAGAGRM